MADSNNTSKTTKTNQEPLGILSLNANGLGEAKKRFMVFQWLKQNHNANKKITFLQETPSTEKTVRGLL